MADLIGSHWENCSRFRVSSTWERKSSQSCNRQFLLNVAKAEMKMLLERFNHAFGGVDSVIVGWDKVDVHMVASDVHFNGLGTLIVHNVKRG